MLTVRKSTLAGMTMVGLLAFSGWSPEYFFTNLGYGFNSAPVVACKYMLVTLLGAGAVLWVRGKGLILSWSAFGFCALVWLSGLRVGGSSIRISAFITCIVLELILFRELVASMEPERWLPKALAVSVGANLALTAALVVRGQSAVIMFDEGPRFSSALGHSPTGLFYLMVTILFLYLGLRRQSALYVGTAIVATIVSLASETRVAAFCLVGVWVIWGWMSSSHRFVSSLMSCLSMLTLGLVIFSHGRLDPRDALSSGTYLGRLIVWQWGLEVFEDSPILGKGTGYTDEYLNSYVATGAGAMHNEYIRLLAEQGLVGALVCGLVLFRYLLVVRRSWSFLERDQRFLTLSSLGSLLIVSYSDNVVHLYYSFSMLLMLGFAVVDSAILSGSRMRAEEEWYAQSVFQAPG